MEENPTPKTSRFDLKSKLIFFLLIILASVSLALFLNMRTTDSLKSEYTHGIEQLETLQTEQQRCSELLTQESGSFDDYEYCRELLRVFVQDQAAE